MTGTAALFFENLVDDFFIVLFFLMTLKADPVALGIHEERTFRGMGVVAGNAFSRLTAV